MKLAAERNGMANQIRRNVCTLLSARHDSFHPAGGCSCAAVSASAPIASLSCSPRTGSRTVKYSVVSISEKQPSTMNAVRHP
jgi:hypothetical protein